MKRRGYTLVELVIVISLLSMLTGVAVMLLTSVISHVGRQRDDNQAAVVVRRLAADFRRDAHAATAAHLEDPPANAAGKLTLTSVDGATVTYAAVSGGVERIATTDQTTAHRELYRLPRAQDVRFAQETIAADRALVICRWKQLSPGVPSSQKDVAPRRDYRLEAALASEVAP